MNTVQALQKLSFEIWEFPKTHDLFLPDETPNDWCIVYDTRILIEWVKQKYRIALLHGKNEQVTLGYYDLADCLTVLKSATL